MSINITYRITTTPDVPTSTTAKGTPLTSAEIDGNFKSLVDGIDSLTANDVASSPVGGISATNVQAALAELDSEKASNTNLALKANIESPGFTGAPTAPTASAGTDTTQLATTAFTTNAVNVAAATAVQKDSNTGSAQLPSGTVAQRSPNGVGKLRYNTETSRFEGNNGTSWGSLGGATGGGNDDAFYENTNVITSSYTISAGKNAMSAGPITVAAGVIITILDGSVWTIV